MRKIILVLSCLISAQLSYSQIVEKPNYGQKSHETLSIEQIETNSNYTIITLRLVNKIENGSFCASKNIYLKNSTGSEMYQILKTENIPTCPESHLFSKKNESFSFRLFFPPISSSIHYLDLVESCDEACFSFRGIILQNTTNMLIDKAFSLYSSAQKENSAKAFEQIIARTKDYPYAFIYFSAIRIWSELGNQQKVKQLKSDLSFSDKLDKNSMH